LHVDKKLVIVGAGISGLQCARVLVDEGVLSVNDILILDAQDYIGGRIKQNSTFISGKLLDMGAEIIHGTSNALHDIGKIMHQTTTQLFVWAQGDGGPGEEQVNGNFGMYYSASSKKLLRFDTKDASFIHMNEVLWSLEHLDEDRTVEMHESLSNYLAEQKVTGEWRDMANAGHANTLCTNIGQLSLHQAARWTRLWNDSPVDGDYRPNGTFQYLVSYLKSGLEGSIRLNCPVETVRREVGIGIEMETCRNEDKEDGSPGSSADEQGRAMITLRLKGGEEVRAEAALVTASAHVINTGLLSFEPPLPETKAAAYSSMDFNNVIKVVVGFSARPWPAHLHGMIMAGCQIPEVWFNDCPLPDGAVADPTRPVCYCVGFCTTEFANNLEKIADTSVDPDRALADVLVSQMMDVFSNLKPEHLISEGKGEDKGAMAEATKIVRELPSFEQAFLKGIHYNWRRNNPYVGGGYASWRAGQDSNLQLELPKPVDGALYFAGECTNMPGATAHAALESGRRAAAQIAEQFGVSSAGFKTINRQ
jgi:monoamine oxidase